MTRLVLSASYSSAGDSPAEQWYHASGQIDACFGVHANGRWTPLLEIILPQEFSMLERDRFHPIGLRLSMRMTWADVLGHDFSPMLNCFHTTPEAITTMWAMSHGKPSLDDIKHQRLTQLSGWARLAAIHLAGTTPRKPLPGLEQQADFWENYLYQEMCDLPWLEARHYGAAHVIAHTDPRRQYNNWLRIASCAAEVLWQAPEARTIFAAARVAPHLFPCLNAGLAEARKHGGIA